MPNGIQRFLFEDLDIRGAVVHLDSVWEQLLARRNYPPRIIELLGQMTATTLLLADNLKQAGRLTIQLRGDGPLSLLVIDCSESLNVRCMAQVDETIGNAAPLVDLLGHGQLLLSLDMDSMKEPYQSVVPLSGHTIAEVFEHYLAQSEQLASRFFLAATPQGVAGLFLQKMPSTDHKDPDGWSRIEALAATVRPDELLALDMDSMKEPYQSVVPLSGHTIAEVFEHYLAQSEQLASRFFLAATPQGVAGLFLQKMPSTDHKDPDGWSRIEALAATVRPDELLALDSTALLRRLFHEETIRIFDAQAVTHHSPMDWEKVRNMLRTLGREDIYGALTENGEIVIRDDLANHEYRFDKAAIDALFSNVPDTPSSIH